MDNLPYKLKMTFAAVLILFLQLVSLGACNDLRVFVLQPVAPSFEAMESLSLNEQGQLEVKWRTKAEAKNTNFDIYLEELEQNADSSNTFSTTFQEKSPLRFEEFVLEDDIAPKIKGQLVFRTKEKFATLPEILKPNVRYLLQIHEPRRMTSGKKVRVSMIEVAFKSISAAKATKLDSKVTISWSEVPGANIYEIYADRDLKVLIAETSANSFDIDTTKFPSKAYYVRSLRGKLASPEIRKIAVDQSSVVVEKILAKNPDGIYKLGDSLAFEVSFSGKVNVFGNANLPILTGKGLREANYVKGTGSNKLTFAYTVQANDDTKRLQSGEALSGEFTDSVGAGISPTLPTKGSLHSLSELSAIEIDSSPPTIRSVNSTLPNGYYSSSQIVPITITFSEVVTVTGNPTLQLETGVSDKSGIYVSGSGTNRLIFNYSVQPGDNSQDLDTSSRSSLNLTGGSIKDSAGNIADVTLPSPGAADSLGANKDIVIDTTSPVDPGSISFLSLDSNTLSVNVTFSVSTDINFQTHKAKFCANLDCDSGCLAEVNAVYSPITLSGNNGSSYHACIQGRDLAGNLSAWVASSQKVSLDSTAPTISSVTSSLANGYYSSTQVVPITITFSENVYVVGEPTLLMETGGTDRNAVYISGSGSKDLIFEYSVQAGDNSQDLDYASTLALNLAGGSIQDIAGNSGNLNLFAPGSAGSLGANKEIIIDTTDPADPGIASFASTHSLSTSVSVSWSTGTDLNFESHNVKLCQNSNCSSSCGTASNFAASSGTMSGSFGNSYFACVQSKDLAGNLSAWIPSSQSILIESAPTNPGIASAEVRGSYLDDGKARLSVKLLGIPSSNITAYRIYYSPDTTSFNYSSPLTTISRGDSRYDSNPGDDNLDFPLTASSLNDGYFVVRYYDSTGSYTDTNTIVSGAFQVLKGQPGYVLIPRLYSGLSYDYYLMRYEASLSASGTNPGGDVVSSTASNIAACSYNFHVNGVAFDVSCGSKVVTKSALSLSGVAPQANISWSTAFSACRNASNSHSFVRMPTSTEWQRASQWIGDVYSDMWTTYSANTGANCKVQAASSALAGTASACKSSLGVFDMAGNLREWVDNRMLRYSISGNSESRFSYGPTIGSGLANGIDNIVSRYHAIDPGTNGLALTMGADFKTPAYAAQKQYGSDVQTWSDPSLSNLDSVGFRCIGFPADLMPSMSELALPDEPKYAASDYPAGSPSTWKIPENFFAKDANWESVSISIEGNTTDSIAEGAISIVWKPWKKTTCDISGTCSASDLNLSYSLYRFIEPNRVSIRTSVPWALSGPESSIGNTGLDREMNPLAVNSFGARIFDPGASMGSKIASITNCDSTNTSACSFVDSTAKGNGFSPLMLYNYILVVEDENGNAIYPLVQRFRSPYFAGTPIVAGAPAFRMEPRYRRASVQLVDEYYQQGRSVPQILVHVPMDVSGLDHDFYAYKYESTINSGTVANSSPAGSYLWPLQGSASSWLSNAAVCHDKFLQNGTFDLTACGNGTVVNATTAIAQSKRGISVANNIDAGAAWKSCRNASVQDANSMSYNLHLITDSEWFKAADWGDVDQDGVIDQSTYAANIGQTITTLENGTANSTSIRCHTDYDPASVYPTANPNTDNCRSRHGAADMVGNIWEWSSGRLFDGVGHDNGIDGFGYGFSEVTGSTAAVSSLDLIRGFPVSTTSWSVFGNGDTFYYNSGLRQAARGGAYGDGQDSGRSQVLFNEGPNSSAGHVGFRCSY